MTPQEKQAEEKILAAAERAERELHILKAQQAFTRAGVSNEAAARDAAELLISRVTDLQVVDGELIGKLDDKNHYCSDGFAEALLSTSGYFRSAAPPAKTPGAPRLVPPARDAAEDFAEGLSQPPKPHSTSFRGFDPPPSAA